MAPRISTDDGAIQSGSSSARSQLDSAMATSGSRAPLSGVDPRLTAAVDDAGAQNRRSAERTGEGIDRTKRDSAGKTAIDRNGAGQVGQVGRGGGLSPAALNALGAAGSALMGGGGSGSPAAAAPAAAQMMPQMPPMPQVPAATAGQYIPSALSNPAAIQLLARLLSAGDGSSLLGGGLMGSGGLSTLSGRGGGSGLFGPSAATGRNQFEQRLLAHAQQVAAARLPYTWGGGTINGPSGGIRDGGAADAAGDYAKSGFDCSSLARYLVYQASGVEIPRTSQAQYSAGVFVNPADARPGDLLFPHSAGVPPTHVTVYVGGGKCLEAQQSGTIIGYSNAQPGTFKRYVSVA